MEAGADLSAPAFVYSKAEIKHKILQFKPPPATGLYHAIISSCVLRM
jgi:hypothetical protein